ncbi:MAG TPA: CPBP family glutamic-type intramembrane protease [Bacteroidales bacterium]|nr:CPBP family glutamic-type intramembrane protease [Bacteroidales bacterium]HQB22688.1 CPBP family glutamic-type intramembrane protease [Bacteroidales bacterium]
MKTGRKLVLLRTKIEQISYKKIVLLIVILKVTISFIFIGFILLANILLNLQLENYFQNLNSDFPTKNAIIATISALILAPIIETSIFQHLIFQFLKVIRQTGVPIMYITISSLLFGLAHQAVWTTGPFLGIVSFIHKVVGGIMLAISYYIFYRKREHAMLSTALIHAVHNAAIVLPVIIIANL